MSADGTGLVRLLLGCAFSGSYPDWSPNGARTLTVHDHDLYAIAPDGSAGEQLTSGGTLARPNHQGRWSRQGTKIAYVHWVKERDGSDVPALFVMAANGASEKRITPENLRVESPSWGP